MARPDIRLHLIGGVWAAVVSFGAMAQGALLAYEGFDYPNDGPEIHGRNGGVGWTAAWDEGANADFAHLTQDDVSLNVASFPFAPAGDRIQGAGGVATRPLPFTFDTSTDGVLYASYLMRKDVDSDAVTTAENVEISLNASATNTQVLRVGSNSLRSFFLARNTATQALPNGSLTLGDTYFIVMKIESFASSPDVFSAQIYDAADASPTAEPATWDLQATTATNFLIDTLRLQIGANTAGGIDEIRFGSSFAAVAMVPECSTFALSLITLSVAGGTLRRRFTR